MASAVTSNLHSVVFSLTAALVIVLTSHAVFSIFSQLMILTGAVMLAGLPHGALDPLVSNYLMGASSFRKRSLFYLNYLLKASMAFIFWLWQPEIMLLLFLFFLRGIFLMTGEKRCLDYIKSVSAYRWSYCLSFFGHLTRRCYFHTWVQTGQSQ